MRRNDKAITDIDKIYAILERSLNIYLAMTDDDVPYVIPVGFGWEKGVIYVHCAKTGRKLDLIRRNPTVGFTAAVDVVIHQVDEAWRCGTTFQSVVGVGVASIVESLPEKQYALDLMMKHYKGESGDVYGKCLDFVCIIKITIQSLTGKSSGLEHLD